MPIALAADDDSPGSSGWESAARRVRRAGRGAADHDLIAFGQAVSNLHELFVLDAGLDGLLDGLALGPDDVDNLFAARAAHRAQRDDEDVVLLVDDDVRRSGHATGQDLIARV